MSYATASDLAALYGQDEIDQRASMLPLGAVDRALADASAEVDSYLAGRYAVPLASPTARLIELAAAIARYKLLGDAATERARNDYLDARAWLKDVQAGRAQVEGLSTLPSAGQADSVATASRTRIFNGGLV